jgi:small subunit ribosomal protein S11
MSSLVNMFDKMVKDNQTSRNATRNRYDPFLSSDGSLIATQAEQAEAHHFHVYATRHNTHITVTRPDRSPLISVSAGNIGFRHAGRKHYDSAFQLASYVLGRMNESGMSAEIKRIEVILRGYGAGREAVTKALLGTEGRFLRSKVIKVADATRLKFGGTRSKKPRRLG